MSIVSRRLWAIVMSLLVVTSLTHVTSSAQSSSPSAQDKAKACNDLADKKGLKDQERKNFLQSCLSKAAGNQPASTQKTNSQQAANDKLNDMSQRDKADVCKNLADKKNLSGSDRRSFLKDCMQKANPK